MNVLSPSELFSAIERQALKNAFEHLRALAAIEQESGILAQIRQAGLLAGQSMQRLRDSYLRFFEAVENARMATEGARPKHMVRKYYVRLLIKRDKDRLLVATLQKLLHCIPAQGLVLSGRVRRITATHPSIAPPTFA
ncbi:hypothetical protein ACWYXJ_01990 [Janthinobacterium lividum]|uniref:hypothetical protein n=1 Tax=Janthinobacterium sp. YR213 TaxID=1881027 RepID=UPI000884FE22|nr:hypothetical protein [Janthinobacterium sp. YR213]SDG73125.1 hypothetical protein SAMN05428968_0584 [Janthinobacterium sp. YR213]